MHVNYTAIILIFVKNVKVSLTCTTVYFRQLSHFKRFNHLSSLKYHEKFQMRWASSEQQPASSFFLCKMLRVISQFPMCI